MRHSEASPVAGIGKFSVEATLLDFFGDKVILEKKDGSTTEVAVERLSDKDKELLQTAYGVAEKQD